MATVRVDKSNFRQVRAPKTLNIRTYPDRPKGIKEKTEKPKKPPIKQPTLIAEPADKKRAKPKYDKEPPEVKMQRTKAWSKR
jgi:hypothetical protein